MQVKSHTFVAMRHSTTRMLKWEEAALFISTQQFEITNTAPVGSFTSLARRGWNSISFAWDKQYIQKLKNELFSNYYFKGILV